MKTLHTALLISIITASSATGGYWWAQHSIKSAAPAATSAQTNNPHKPLFWYDPMMPNQHFDKPGKSPFMDMQLIPKYADEGDDSHSVKIDPALSQNLGMRLTKVTKGILPNTLNATGTLTFNERDLAIVQARSGGFVERSYAHAPGDSILQGAPLVDVLMPEWAGAQAEFLAIAKSGDSSLIHAARERLHLLGMSYPLIQNIEKKGHVHAVITISAPLTGIIQSLDARPGMTLMPGQTLAKINGLKTVWLEIAVPESQANQVSIGNHVEARFNAFPGETTRGKVIAILPETNLENRTLKVRVELPNPKGRLKPGLFAQVQLIGHDSKPVLLIPSEAIIRTGKRTLVMLAEDGGRYQPVEVETGYETEGQTTILRGLEEGQRVVASGQFLIDSEANLKSVVTRTLEKSSTPEQNGSQP